MGHSLDRQRRRGKEEQANSINHDKWRSLPKQRNVKGEGILWFAESGSFITPTKPSNRQTGGITSKKSIKGEGNEFAGSTIEEGKSWPSKCLLESWGMTRNHLHKKKLDDPKGCQGLMG